MAGISFPTVPNLVTVDNYSNRLNMLIQTKVVYPYNFSNVKKEFKLLYSEAVHSFLYGCPDAALSLAVRCLEQGLKHYLDGNNIKEIHYKDKNNNKRIIKLSYARLFDLIQCDENPVKDKDILQYLKSLRNYTHEDKLVEDFHALEAIKHVTDVLNELFSFKTLTITVEQCRLCGENHSINIDPKDYFIGNRIILKCPNRSEYFNKLGEFVVDLQ
jgi:hypothetical protein